MCLRLSSRPGRRNSRQKRKKEKKRFRRRASLPVVNKDVEHFRVLILLVFDHALELDFDFLAVLDVAVGAENLIACTTR